MEGWIWCMKFRQHHDLFAWKKRRYFHLLLFVDSILEKSNMRTKSSDEAHDIGTLWYQCPLWAATGVILISQSVSIRRGIAKELRSDGVIR